jgi:hypothetical protein
VGVSIHYRGRLNDGGQLAKLCEELADIARAMGWETTRLDDDWEQPANPRLRFTAAGAHIDGNLGLKGILIRPGGGAESLRFCFDRAGHLRCPIGMVSSLDGTPDPKDAWVSVKTQFASFELHVWVVALLKYLKKRYIADLEVSDEGQYWETGDVQILRERMDLIGRKIDQLATELSSPRLGRVSGLSLDEIVSKIEQWFLEDRDEDGPPKDG